ncbi:20S rRNA accumulation protein 4 [Hanseniaspora osmophila]|uniref:20S rRNA accumulation protein 4 n=1 Tax=Hanseniaspora osmophila TaxID=56408 RepID=A0A1E5RZK4_9ASCO|nr:20S rRNA accumulation protein 4 [Hanseniaspora osmophila]
MMSQEELKIKELKISDDASHEESDYDDDDESIYEKGRTEVYLGLVDANIKGTDEVTVEDTFIGGDPVWLHPDSEPNCTLLKCKSCAQSMKLLMQAFAPLDKQQVEEITGKSSHLKLTTTQYIDSNDDRVLYIFVCNKCNRKEGSIRCIRGVKKANSLKTTKLDLSENDNHKQRSVLGDGFQNPFVFSTSSSAPNPFDKEATTSNPFGSAASNPFETTTIEKPSSTPQSLEQLSQKNQPSAKTLRKLHDQLENKKFSGFPGYFVYVEAESFKNKTPDHLKMPENIRIDESAISGEDDYIQSVTNGNASKNVTTDPRTEKLSKILDDDVFQKFQEIVGYNPGQVLRYDLGGDPLLYCQDGLSNKKLKDYARTVASPTYNPGSARVFEMQLMPKLIIDLEESISLKEGMEWGTIMVFTDIENYIPHYDEHGVGYVEELCKVQWEPRN